MSDNELNNDDIRVLMQALDALESKADRDGLLGSMLGIMFSKDKDEAIRNADEQMRLAEKEGNAIKETVILLKAKLIRMKDRLTIKEANNLLLGRK